MKDIHSLIRKYRSKGLIIDTNLLLLLIVGLYDKNFICQHRRLEKYEIDDFEWLKIFIGNFNCLVVTPHILSELSNLSFTMKNPKLKDYFKTFILVLKEFKEESLPLNNILNLKILPLLGVTDSALIEVAKTKKYLVVTDDLDAFVNLEKHNLDAVNYTYIKSLIWEKR